MVCEASKFSTSASDPHSIAGTCTCSIVLTEWSVAFSGFTSSSRSCEIRISSSSQISAALAQRRNAIWFFHKLLGEQIDAVSALLSLCKLRTK